jgi:hypothetical protein
MWKCSKCGEEVEDDFEVCWNCSTAKDGTPLENSTPASQTKVASSAKQPMRPDERIKGRERFLYASLLCGDLWLGMMFFPYISDALGLENPFEGIALIIVMNPLGWFITLVLIVSLIFLTGYYLFVGPNTVRMRLVLWYVLPVIGFSINGLASDAHLAPGIASLGGFVLIFLGGLLPLVWLTIPRHSMRKLKD